MTKTLKQPTFTGNISKTDQSQADIDYELVRFHLKSPGSEQLIGTFHCFVGSKLAEQINDNTLSHPATIEACVFTPPVLPGKAPFIQTLMLARKPPNPQGAPLVTVGPHGWSKTQNFFKRTYKENGNSNVKLAHYKEGYLCYTPFILNTGEIIYLEHDDPSINTIWAQDFWAKNHEIAIRGPITYNPNLEVFTCSALDIVEDLGSGKKRKVGGYP